MKQAVLVLALAGALVTISCLSESVQERFTVGMDLLYEGRYQDAESHFLVLARELSRASDDGARVWRARALYQAGMVEHLYLDQPRRAVARLREALKLTPHAQFSFRARREIALIFHDKLKDYRSAALEFERLVQAFPDREGIEEYQYRIAQSYFVLREFSQARTEARLLLEKHPESPLWAETMLLVANSFYVEGRFQEAADFHRQLLSKHPSEEIESRSLFELGMCYQELGEYKKAEQNLLMALKMHPRPDIVQLQLTSLRDRQTEEGSKGKQSLPYATAGRHGSGVKKAIKPQPQPQPVGKGERPPRRELKKTPEKKPPAPPVEKASKPQEAEEPEEKEKPREEQKPAKEKQPPGKKEPEPPRKESPPPDKAPEKAPKKPTPAAAPAAEKPAE
jgi:tetratricopeptide (TPR) repeat protein